MGSHTDYNEGYVLPIAIDRDVRIAWAPRDDGRCVLWSSTFSEERQFSLGTTPEQRIDGWAAYPAGVVWSLREAGCDVAAVDAVIASTVPLGGGLSSSAAIEVATALACMQRTQTTIPPAEMARLCQRAENEYVGMNCGIMDQMVSACGRRDHALFLDCRTLETDHIPLPGDRVAVVVLDTNKPHELIDSQYNVRRAECEQAAAHCAARDAGVRALRDVSSAQLAEWGAGLADNALRRARHVVSENERVLRALDVLRAGDLSAFGQLMSAAQVSFREDFDGSCEELEVMIEIALSTPGVLGALTSGAGWGGCVAALADPDAVETLQQAVHTQYPERTGLTPKTLVCHADDGAGPLDVA